MTASNSPYINVTWDSTAKPERIKLQNWTFLFEFIILVVYSRQLVKKKKVKSDDFIECIDAYTDSVFMYIGPQSNLNTIIILHGCDIYIILYTCFKSIM